MRQSASQPGQQQQAGGQSRQQGSAVRRGVNPVHQAQDDPKAPHNKP